MDRMMPLKLLPVSSAVESTTQFTATCRLKRVGEIPGERLFLLPSIKVESVIVIFSNLD